MEIQIFGETITIKHSLRVQHAYEEMLDIPFALSDLSMTKNRMALYLATIMAYNETTAITMDSILDADLDTIQVLDKAVNTAVTEWYKLPAATNDPALNGGENEDGKKKV